MEESICTPGFCYFFKGGSGSSYVLSTQGRWDLHLISDGFGSLFVTDDH